MKTRSFPGFVIGFFRLSAIVAIAACSLVAQIQNPVPCKYFPLRSEITAASSGGQIEIEIQADPLQFERGKHRAYSKQCDLAVDSPSPWITLKSVSELNAEGRATIVLSVEPAEGQAEEREAVFSLGTAAHVYPGAAAHFTTSIFRVRQPPAPQAVIVNAGGVVNNASYSTQVSPGSLFSIFGNFMAAATTNGFPIPLPTNFNGTSVTVNGVPAPLLFVSPTLINAQVPMNISPGTATVSVSYSGTAASTTVAVVPASPGFFFSAVNGIDYAIGQHANGTLVTAANPARPGENLAFYATGVGPISPTLQSGQGAGFFPNLSVATSSYSCRINGVTAAVSFLGLTPGLVGLVQMNLQVPLGIPSGNVPIVLTVNGVNSQSNAVVAIAGGGTILPTIDSFSANPNSITAGQSTTLTWSVSADATTVSIGGIGSVARSGSIAVSPSSSTAYKLSAANAAGTATAQASVSVSQPVIVPTINSFTADTSSIVAGNSTTLRWSVFNASNVSITGIGSVAASGSVTVAPAVSTAYTLTATSTGGSRISQLTINVSQAQSVTLVFTNQLLNSANVSVNGTVVGNVAAGSTRQVTVPSQLSVNVTFDVIRSKTTGGTSIGDPMSGYFDPLVNPTGTVNFTIGNYFSRSNTYFFIPVITNNSGTNLTIVVNYQLASENKCNCVVDSGAGPTETGYYLLYSNSNVSAFAAGSNYTGRYRQFSTDLSGSVAQGSGRLGLTFSVFP